MKKNLMEGALKKGKEIEVERTALEEERDQLQKDLKNSEAIIESETKNENNLLAKKNLAAEKEASNLAIAEQENAVKQDIKKTFEEEQKKKDNAEINIKLKSIGLSEDHFKDNLDWQDFSKAEKLLIIEQASQNTLSHVRELGEKRFAEENTIQRSWNPSKWKWSVVRKTWNNLGKSYWISKAEKDVLREVEQGKIKPDEKVLNTLIERQSDLGLEVIEKDGRAFIEFAKGNENLSKEQKIIMDRYNQTANNFAQLPDSWKNERSAKSTDKMFSGEKNHEKYEGVKAEYEKEKAILIKDLVNQYEASGMSKTEAKEKVMLDIKDKDYVISMLQFTNTNPDAFEELEKIRTESSWGRLVNNENIWRAGYMAAGYTSRKVFMGTVGWLTAPITAGVIGGIRGRRKANENIDKTFNEGRKEETFLERREAGKKGLFDNKNEGQGAWSYVLQGEKVNTKEVAAFIDADSQKQRIDNLVNKIDNAKNDSEKASLMVQLEARLHYIELKQSQGLVNYGKENPTAVNYELFKTMSEAYVASTTIDNLGIPLTREMNEDLRERDALLASVMARNEAAFGEKIASHKNAEMLRGAVVGAGFATLGGLIREWMHGNHIQTVIAPAGATSHGVDAISGPDLKHIEHIVEHAKVEAVADHGQGAISTLRELQHNLKTEYPDLSKAPESVKHILNTDAHKLAQEYGMYKPGNDAESAFLKSGDKFTVDETGNVKFGNNLLEKGNEIKVDHAYEGKMFDSDHSGEVHESLKIPEQVDPVTGKPLHEIIQNQGEQINPENGQYYQDYINHQVNPENGNLANGADGQPINPEDGQYYHDYKNSTSDNLDKHNIDEHQNGNTEKGVDTSHTNNETHQQTNTPVHELSNKELRQIHRIQNHNIDKIYPNEYDDRIWHTARHMNANELYNFKPNDIADEYKPLYNYLHKLNEVTGIKPFSGDILHAPETNEQFINEAIKTAAKMNKLNEVKL